ncbi:MAG: hypothetical protein ABIW76_15185 [Fibrobacteria bacterium]
MNPSPFLALLLALLGLSVSGCIVNLKPDQAALTANASNAPATRSSPDCASCHAYPLHDVMHNYHLRALNPRATMQEKFVKERKNGVIICMDCHFGSLAHRNYMWYDTLWGVDPDIHDKANRLPTDPIYRIDSTPGFLPLTWELPGSEANSDRVMAMMDSAADIGSVITWLTAQNHLNGTVDVEFSSSMVLDPARSRSAYRARDLSCSAIECHNAPKKTYRWASKNLGITGCPTLEHSPVLDASCDYSPLQEPK